MATSKCVYPYPVLIIEGIQEQRLNEDLYPATEYFTIVRDVRLSFYQLAGKPWDWSRARRLADACYRSHGALSIEDPLGNVWLDGEQPAERRPRAVSAARSKEAKLRAALEAAWSFIENVTDEDPRRTDKFFATRELVREAWAA